MRSSAARFASVARLHDLLLLHETLLGDARRNRAFARALAARVRPGSRVLDLGAGTGVWSIVAARLGAERVVAVEKEPMLVPIIERLARENGVGGRVEVRLGDSRRLSLPREFDVIVSETVGNHGFDEGIVGLLADARRRFLRPGGVLVPQAVSLRAAPAASRLADAPISLRALRELQCHFPRAVPAGSLRPLAAPIDLLHAELRTARSTSLRGLSGEWTVRDAAAVAGIAVWVALDLAPGVRLETLRGTHWSPSLLPVEPLGAGRGRLAVNADLAPPRASWRVAWRGRGRERRWEFSPLFAYGSIVAAMR